MIQTIKDGKIVKRSIQKNWNINQFLEEASQREDINEQVKDMKEDFKLSKVGYNSEDSPKRFQILSNLSENKTTRKKRKRKAKAVVTVERQSGPCWPKLPSIRTTVFKVWQVQSFCIVLQNLCPNPRGM